MNHTIDIRLGDRSYPVMVGSGLLRDPDAFRPALGQASLVVTSETVAGLYLDTLSATLGEHPHAVLTLPDGDVAKSLAQVEAIATAASDGGIGRDGSIIALGGGAVCDVAGFAAATYQRGIAVIQVPTTLLAQVDASVGGKAAVNHPRGKNLVGAFHQPARVVADTTTLQTLPARELAAGLAEVIKYALLADAGMFEWLERHMDRLVAGDEAVLTEAVLRCCRIKAGIVADDETESGRRALLNLGHTFGHALETATDGSMLHGEAVAVGCLMATALSNALGWLGATDRKRIEQLVRTAGLPARPPQGVTAERLLALMQRDKKVAAGRIRLVLLQRIGEALVTADYPHAALVMTLREFTEE